MRTETPTQERERLIGEAMLDPVLFARAFLGDNPTDVQAQLMRACAISQRPVAARGCSSSKTHALAEVAIWFVCRYPDGIVITTAPTSDQVEDVMWRQKIIPMLARCRVRVPEPNSMRFAISVNNYITGFTTKIGAQAVRFQGAVQMRHGTGPG